MKKCSGIIILLAVSLICNSQKVKLAEYFFDTDPGLGNGIHINITYPTYDSVLNIDIDVSSLDKGYHTLYIRMQSDSALWSMTMAQLFYTFQKTFVKKNVADAEYFIDTDPGFGSGTPISFPAVSKDTVLELNYSTLGLELGFHSMYLRTKDEDAGWSLTWHKYFYVYPLPDAINKVNRMEYFFDNDPGYGMAQPVNIDNPFNDSVLVFDINTTGLTPDFHSLYLRTRDDDGWSLIWHKYFYVYPLPDAINKVNRLEYFFDNDPGYGMAQPVNIDNPFNDSVLVFDINTTGLTPDFHSLYLRSRDDDGWSLIWHKYFYVYSLPDNIDKVSRLEYFFDNDPGFGLAYQVSIENAFIDSTLVFGVNASSLTQDFHTLNIRLCDEKGLWSLVYQKDFYYNDPDVVKNKLEYVEYYFDSDPGLGMATPIKSGFSSFDTTLVNSIDPKELSEGFHMLNIRARDDKGSWSFLYHKYLYYSGDNGPVENVINYAEYFLDKDPGVGKGIPMVIDIPFKDKAFVIDSITPDITRGFHSVFFRFRDQKGAWSIPVQKIMFFYGLTDTLKSKINYGEYFFDDDPGIGLGKPISVGKPFIENTYIMVFESSEISPGFHKLFVRFRDDKLRWGLTIQRYIYVFDFQQKEQSEIVNIEYFIDNDPGFGKGKPVAVSTIGNDISEVFELDMNNIDSGDHILYIRCKNSIGYWGLPYIYSFSYDVNGLNESNIKSWFSLYPNPNTGDFTIEMTALHQQGTVIKILNMNGKVIYTRSLDNEINPISLTLSPGLYIIKVDSGNDHFSKKLIIQH